ncbi:MAG: M55 family metallopeptidase [Ferrovibrio sp.]
MRVLIVADSEGQAGLVRERVPRAGWRERLRTRLLRRPAEYTYGLFQAEFNREQMSREAAACARAALAAGAREVVVLDGGFIRGYTPVGLVIIPQMLPKGTKLAQGGVPLNALAAEGWDAAIMIGCHAKAGTKDGVMAHTFSDHSIASLAVNDTEIGEIAVEALVLGHYRIPVVLVSGDAAACREAVELLPSVRTVCTKRGFGAHIAVSLHVEDACDLLEQETRTALADIGTAKPLIWPAPFSVRLTCRSEDIAKRRAHRYPSASVTGRVISYQAATAQDIY